MNMLARSVLVLASCCAMAACGTARRSEPLTGPLALNDPQLQHGKVLYDRYCYHCHMSGEGGLAPTINDKPLPRFLMRFQVRHGLGAMPAFSPDVIKDDELDEIVDYLVALRHHG
jgi:mono/diheme cytochrome c family protein